MQIDAIPILHVMVTYIHGMKYKINCLKIAIILNKTKTQTKISYTPYVSTHIIVLLMECDKDYNIEK